MLILAFAAILIAPLVGAWLGRRACDTVCYFTAAELEQLRRRFE